MPIVPAEELKEKFNKILLKYFNPSDSELCADIFLENTLTGIFSHGVNRFPFFIEMIKQGVVIPNIKPVKVNSFNALEQWDGLKGAGPLNAWFITERTIELADNYGIGCIALKNTNHWMRAGTYGWKAARSGYIFICWTNTIPNLPPWGAKEAKTGNNPVVFAFPDDDSPVVLDMALSQYSFGKLDTYIKSGEQLPFEGGYNNEGILTKDPSEINESLRPLPVGLWKGTGLSLLLDLMAASLSGGKATFQLNRDVDTEMSQIFIAINPESFFNLGEIKSLTDKIILNFKSAEPIDNYEIFYPGEKSKRNKEKFMHDGIPINEEVWQEINQL